MKCKKTLLFGGTFDPVHEGHMHILKEAELNTDYERLILMPARINNFKQGSKPASGEDRYNMLKIALSEYKCERMEIILSDLELKRDGVSYTDDTVLSVLSAFPVEGRLGFLMGTDLLSSLEKWYRFEELKKLVTFICFSRGPLVEYNIPGADIHFLGGSQFEASSSEVRGGNLDHLSKGVREYVLSHGLYRSL